MGAWGYKPFENDSALDWIGGISASKHLEKNLRRTLGKPMRSEYDNTAEIRAASEVLIYGYQSRLLSETTAAEIANMAILRLKEILSMDEWLNGWDDSKAIRRSIHTQIKNINSKILERQQLRERRWLRLYRKIPLTLE